jgi:hypothetical protein
MPIIMCAALITRICRVYSNLTLTLKLRKFWEFARLIEKHCLNCGISSEGDTTLEERIFRGMLHAHSAGTSSQKSRQEMKPDRQNVVS